MRSLSLRTGGGGGGKGMVEVVTKLVGGRKGS